MSDYVFRDYHGHLFDVIVGEDQSKEAIDKLLEAYDNIDPHKMAVYYFKEVQRMPEGEFDKDRRQEFLLNAVGNVLDALSDGEVNKIATTFYALGRAAESFRGPSLDEMSEFNKAKYEKLRREQPLMFRNKRNKEIKVIAQNLARDYWSLDEKQELKLIDMCHKVWSFFITRGFELPLNEATGLKPWLRPVAKEFGYPSMQGRPKRKN